MNVIKIIIFIVIVGCLVYVMLPRIQPSIVYQQHSPGLNGQAVQPQDQDIIRVNPHQSLQQRIWIPGILINEMRFFMYVPPNQLADRGPSVTVLSDNDGQRGDILLVPHVQTVALQNYVELILRFDKPLPVAEYWVWVQIASSLPTKPVYFFRDIDGGAYPDSQLILQPIDKTMHGVLAFTIFSPQLIWRSASFVIWIFAGLLGFWIFVKVL